MSGFVIQLELPEGDTSAFNTGKPFYWKGGTSLTLDVAEAPVAPTAQEAIRQLLEDARYMGKYAAVSRNPGNPFFDSQILAKKIGKYLGTVIEDKK